MSPLTKDRFEELALAYGGQVARWPAQTQDAAALLMTAEPAFARAVLARAENLDAALDAWIPAPASVGLRDAVLACAPKDVARPVRPTWLWRAGLGAGLAAACAAGLLLGVGLSPDPQGSDEIAAAMASYDGDDATGDIG